MLSIETRDAVDGEIEITASSKEWPRAEESSSSSSSSSSSAAMTWFGGRYDMAEVVRGGDI